jgi:hypothetical protein
VWEPCQGRYDPRAAYQDDAIVAVYYRAVVPGRPTRWAVRPDGWPAHFRAGRPSRPRGPCPGG